MKKQWIALVALAIAGGFSSNAAAINYITVDVPAAFEHGGNLIDGYIRGNGTDSFDPTNINGSLSWTGVQNLPFGQPNVAQYLSGASTWDVFNVSANSVSVGSFEFTGAAVQHNGAFSVTDIESLPQTIDFTLDGFMNGTFSFNFASGGTNTEIDFSAFGGFIINDPGFGIDTATASQFPTLGPFAQGAADYLNFVRDTHLPSEWTAAGVWFYGGQYDSSNTRGDLFPLLDGGQFFGYSAWYSTDAFLYGQPLEDANDDGLFSTEEVDALIANDDFPEILGLDLAGEEFAQIYEVELVEGDGTIQTVVFDYDASLLAPGEEELLRIVHYVDGAWETPDQTLDQDLDQIIVNIDNFSPFALVTVPVPGALILFAPALALLRLRCQRGQSC